MSDKYIIRNCPSCRQYQVGIYTCDDLYDCDLQRCQDCTDCLLKQIVELCKNIKSINKRNSYVGEYIEFTQHSPLAEEILELLDIQEIE